MKFLKVMVALVIVASVIGAGVWAVIKYLPSFESIPAYKVIPDLATDRIAMVIEDQPISMRYSPKIVDDKILLPIDFVQEYVDPYFFWDEKAGKLTVTTNNKVIRMKTDELTYYINQEPLELDMPVQLINNVPYIPITFLVEFFDIEFVYHPDNKLVTMDYTTEKKVVATTNREKTNLRYEPTIKSPSIDKLGIQEEVVIYEQLEGWVKVRTTLGLLGYVQDKYIENIQELMPVPEEEASNKPSWQPIEGKVNLVWHQVFKNTDMNQVKGQITDVKGLDVVSPTWFSIGNEEGDIENIADRAYVDWAHQQGVQVWALFDNQFDPDLTHQVLSNTDTREKIIKQLLALSSLYDLDGINIDFESVAAADGKYFVQFIRELTPLLKEQGLVVSVDMYVPSSWTRHYNRTEVGKVVDYIMIMAYDEHWATSPESGSVASIGFVERGIQATLEEVPSEKILLGLPYYTRLWEETTENGEIEVSSSAYGMQRAYDILKDNGAEILWNDEVQQYYGEYERDGQRYRIWLEEERSIEEKVKMVDKYKLGGVAGWKKGLEKPEIWDVLYQYLKP